MSKETSKLSNNGQKFNYVGGEIFGVQWSPKFFTVDCKPYNISQTLVGLGSVVFLWEAWQEQKC